MPLGYVPDFRNSRHLVPRLKDLYLRVLGMPFYERRIEGRSVFHKLGKVGGLKVVDLGCGDGLFTIELAGKGAVVSGVDINETALARAQRRVHQLHLDNRVNLVSADASGLPFPSDHFDKAVCNCTLEHITNDLEALKEINRVLKEKGLLVITVPFNFEGHQRVPLRLAKALLRLPHKLKRAIGSPELLEAESFYQYCHMLIEKYAHARFGYSAEEIIGKLKQASFDVESISHYLKMFGTMSVDLRNSFACFHVERGGQFGYVGRHEWLLGLCFPIFYAVAMLDYLLPSQAPGLGMCIAARKKGRRRVDSDDR
jgi:ubiquinone/menaquinone biosynthesis C-methylase UbiE